MARAGLAIATKLLSLASVQPGSYSMCRRLPRRVESARSVCWGRGYRLLGFRLQAGEWDSPFLFVERHLEGEGANSHNMRWTYADACAKVLGPLCFVVANMRVEASFTTGLVYFFFSTFNVFSQPGLSLAYGRAYLRHLRAGVSFTPALFFALDPYGV